MAFNPSSPVTGTAQTGLTSPTFTITADVAPDLNGKQFAVTALGGTQTGVTTHSMASPFTLTYVRTKSPKPAPRPSTTTGLIGNAPMNSQKMIVRKGVIPLAGQAPQVASVTVEIRTPAGSDTADANSIRAMLALAFGAAQAQSSGIGDTVVTNIL